MTRAVAAELAGRHGINLPEPIWDRMAQHVRLLEKWQPSINLVSRTTLADVWLRHVLDSLQLLPLIPATASTLVDLGSGAGFPGLVLAAACPGLAVRLIESDSRKCAFLGESARAMDANPRIINARIEDAPAEPADIVTARGLAIPDPSAC